MTTKKARTSKEKTQSDPLLEGDKVYLTEAELRMLDKGDLEHKLRIANKRVIEREYQILEAEIQVKQEQLKVLSMRLVNSANSDRELLQAHKAEVHKLRLKYGVGPKDSWGHDPISGEIIIDRKE